MLKAMVRDEGIEVEVILANFWIELGGLLRTGRIFLSRPLGNAKMKIMCYAVSNLSYETNKPTRVALRKVNVAVELA